MTQEAKQPNWSAAFNDAAFHASLAMMNLGMAASVPFPTIATLNAIGAGLGTYWACKSFADGLDEPISEPPTNDKNQQNIHP